MRIVAILLMMSSVASIAQTDSAHIKHWSVRLSGGLNIAASESMKGTVDGVVNDAADDYIVTQYPFDDPTSALGFGLDLGYRLSDRVGLYFGASADFWSNEVDVAYNATADLTRIGGEVGLSAVIWPITNGLDLVGRAGLQVNVYSGEIVVSYGSFFTYTTTVNPALRLGANLQSGLAYTFPGSPLTIDIMGGYANGNLVGKSFTKPSATPNADLNEIELNDGANPDDPSDEPRVISLWSARLGVALAW